MSKDIYQQIADYLKSHPKAFIAYWDSGEWEIYPHKPSGLDTGEVKLKPRFEGHDYNSTNGYVPTIAEVLALALGIEVWSI